MMVRCGQSERHGHEASKKSSQDGENNAGGNLRRVIESSLMISYMLVNFRSEKRLSRLNLPCKFCLLSGKKTGHSEIVGVKLDKKPPTSNQVSMFTSLRVSGYVFESAKIFDSSRCPQWKEDWAQ